MSEKKTDTKPTGIDRWKSGVGKGDELERGSKSSKPAKKRRPLPADTRHALGYLACALVLVIAAVAAAWPPAERFGWGSDFAGATETTFTAADASLASEAASKLQGRLDALEVKGAEVSASDDGTVTVRVPSGVDGASAVSAASGVGHLELALVDSITDPEALARLSAGASDVTLEEGTYEVLVDGSEFTSAEVVSVYSYLSMYGITLGMNSDAASRFAEATAEIAPVNGKIAVIVDGTVVTAPAVSQEIDGGQVSISYGFTLDEATALKAAVDGGALPTELTDETSTTVAPVVGTEQLLRYAALAGAVAAVVLVALLVVLRLLGLVAFGSFAVATVLEAGGISLFSSLGVFVPSLKAYVLAAIIAIVPVIVAAGILWSFRASVRAGRDPRLAARNVLAPYAKRLGALAVLLVVVDGIAPFFLMTRLEAVGCLTSCLVAIASWGISLILVFVPLLRLAAAGPMRSKPALWGVATKDDGDNDAKAAKRADAAKKDAAKKDGAPAETSDPTPADADSADAPAGSESDES